MLEIVGKGISKAISDFPGYAVVCAPYAVGCEAYAVGCAAQATGCAAYVCRCEIKATSVLLS